MSSGADLFVVCKSCGREVSPYVTECPYCGTRIRKRAPKLDKEGRAVSGRLRDKRPTLGRLRPGEIPGIRAESRGLVTIALVAGALGATLAWEAGLFHLADVAVLGSIGSDWWRPLAAPFVSDNTGYALAALAAIALFGWLLERRHGHVAVAILFLLGGAGGMAVASVQDFPVALGGNGAALALLAAWGVPELLARQAGRETDADLIGVGVFAAVLLAMPLAVESADPLAGLTGGVVGVLAGLLLGRVSFAR
jgi:membrane associated rhomboid family serine protease